MDKENLNIGNDPLLKGVKSSFEAEGMKAPDIWADLSKEIGQQNKMDAHIKRSFGSISNLAPERNWDHIQNQLDIDKVWKRISAQLDRKPILIAWWKIAAAAAILVGLIGAGIYTTSRQDATNSFEEPIAKNEIHSELIAGFGQFKKINDQETVANYSLTNKELESLQNNNSFYLDQGISESITDVTNGNNVKENSNHSFTTTASENPSQEEKVEEQKIDLIADTDLLTIPIELGEISMPKIEIQQRKDEFSPTFTLGAFGGYSNTWIMDDQSKEGMHAESLTDTKISFGERFGIAGRYQFAPQFSLKSRLILRSRNNQMTSGYEQGRYTEYETEIVSTQLSTSLHYDWAISNRHQFSVGVGGFAGLMRYTTTQAGEYITSINSKYKNIDAGIYVEIGSSFKLNNLLSIEYGVNSNLGLNDIWNGQYEGSNLVNPTNTYDIGLFLGLNYHL